MRRAETEADDLLAQGLRRLFKGETSPGYKLTVEKVYDLIEAVVDRSEDQLERRGGDRSGHGGRVCQGGQCGDDARRREATNGPDLLLTASLQSRACPDPVPCGKVVACFAPNSRRFN